VGAVGIKQSHNQVQGCPSNPTHGCLGPSRHEGTSRLPRRVVETGGIRECGRRGMGWRQVWGGINRGRTVTEETYGRCGGESTGVAGKRGLV
jgi:hypothetical protein